MQTWGWEKQTGNEDTPENSARQNAEPLPACGHWIVRAQLAERMLSFANNSHEFR